MIGYCKSGLNQTSYFNYRQHAGRPKLEDVHKATNAADMCNVTVLADNPVQHWMCM